MRRDITLFDACWGGHSAFAKMLLTSGANPNFQNKVRVHVCDQLRYDHDFKLDDHSDNSIYMIGRYFMFVYLKQKRA